MDWTGLLAGAVLGAVAGLVVQNLMFPRAEARFRRRRERERYAASNRAWERVEGAHPGLTLVQSGWGDDGYFPEGSVVLRPGRSFRLSPRIRSGIRRAHEGEWTSQGFVDQPQIGVARIVIRHSGAPTDQLKARSHHMELTAQRFRYFDYLATHVTRVRGSETERQLLDEVVGHADPHTPATGFPNPCSVGLSLFCEAGTGIILPRRSTGIGTGGWWAGGRIFNAVGEGTAPRDLYDGFDGSRETTPHQVARRGLHEEVGLSRDDVQACVLEIHSMAWATDLLDHKFFGLVISPLSHGDIQDRWRKAPHRSETSGIELEVWPTRTDDDCMALVRSIRDATDDWAPEAVFSTLRSLLCLRLVDPNDLLDAFSSRTP